MVDAIIIVLVIILLFFALKGSLKHFKGESPWFREFRKSENEVP